MGKPAAMADHFDAIAGHYRDVRTTDEEPIRFIRDALAGRAAIAAADIGCGAGRYDLLLFRHLPNLRLTCVDSSPEMLAELSRYLAGEGIADFETVTAHVEDLDDGADLDVSLICRWIAFNSLYGQWNGEKREPSPDIVKPIKSAELPTNSFSPSVCSSRFL